MRRLSPLHLLIAALFALLFLHLVTGLSFTDGVSINSGQLSYTTDDLLCAWNVSGDTTAINVTWYKGGAYNRSTYDNSTLNATSTISSSETLKNEAWRCTVTLFNATANTSQSANLTIQNSAPSTPVLYNTSGQDVSAGVNVTEDETTVYDLNATDPDSDTLLYYLKAAGFCSVTDSGSGAVSCTPVHSYIANASEGENPTQVNITFWVDDDDLFFAKSSSLKVAFTIVPVNDAPNVSIPTQTTNVTATFNQTFAASDEEHGYPLTASLAYNLTDSEIRDDITVGIEGDSTLRIVYFTSPTDYNDVGNRTVTVNLTDTGNESTLVNFTLQILGVNREPYFTNISPANWSSSEPYTYVVAQGDTLVINVSANDPDTADRNETITFGDNTTLFSLVPVNATATNVTDATSVINYTALNAHVGGHTVLITLTDGQGAQNSTTLNFTVTNVNDPPVISNESYDANNTGGNVNITPLVAYLDAPFRYQVNYSDPDVDIGLDTLSWSDNTSTFNVTQAGLISFTPSGSVRNETVNVTVQDLAGANDSRAIILEIRNNTPPYFNGSFPTLACDEGQACSFNVSAYALDDDPGDNVSGYAAAFTGAELSSFSIDPLTGLVSFMPLQAEIGSYTANITITDSRGASASQPLNITVSNTEDYPVWTRYDFSGYTIVADHDFAYQLRATDQDLLLANSTESLSFAANLTWVTITYEQTINNTAYALLSFTPNASHVGGQSLQLNVTDATNRTNTTTVSFTVLADTEPPNITGVRPYANASGGLVDGWKTVLATSGTENVTLPENTSSLLFSLNASDDTTPNASLNYTWYYDGALNKTALGSSGKSDTFSFGFFDSGNHTVRVVINDTTLESSSWTWNLNVTDVNRPPVLQANFSGSKNNLNITQAVSYSNYFVYSVSAGGFYDPDDDPAGSPSGFATSNYTLDLTYTASSCNYATIAMSGNDLTITPTSVGTCYVTFTAEDAAGENATSNLVTITVTEVPEGAQTTVLSSGGGGGGTTTQNTLIPLETEVETPRPLSLVTPQLVTIYRNRTVLVPVDLVNNWTESLEGISLGAQTNASGVELSFDTDYVEELPVNGTRRTLMTVSGYRLGSNFEVTISANVTTPSFHDEALILFNSIEQSQEGKDIEVKVTFAQDLLSQSAECQELNELLSEADRYLAEGDITQAGQLVDTVINGCRYLISRTRQETQKPGIIWTPLLEINDEILALLSWIALGAALIGALAGLLYYHHKTKKEYDF